ncbi:MAG: Hsp33 family molecular chaperone HslO [Firmicutes bacterium]|nr:Hsp33 family molecular chaperone HslO [Bacillota bacterium]
MRSQDRLVRGIIGGDKARAFVLRTTDVVNEAQACHHTYPVATAALGRTLTIALVLGAMLKGDESVTVQVRGSGILNGIVAVADSKGHVRGYVGNPQAHLPLTANNKLAVGEAVGRGLLFVMRDLGLKEKYQGSVPIQTGEIGDDFAYYFALSEQTPSVVSLGVLVNPDNSVRSAGGLVVQLLPGGESDDAFVAELERIAADLPPMSQVFVDDVQPGQVLQKFFGHLGVKLISEVPVSYSCDCSRERFQRGLVALGTAELEDLIAEGEPVETVCRFCSKRYLFPLAEVKDLLAELRRS